MGSYVKILTFWGHIVTGIFFSDFAEIFTWVVFEVEKFVDQVRFTWFCHFQGENWGQRSKFWLLRGQNWSEISTFNSIFDHKKDKIMQIWHYQQISRPRKLFWWKLHQNQRKKNPDQIWPQIVKILTFDPIFDPENGKITQIWHDQWISRPQKLFWSKFQPNWRKKIFKCCYKKRKFLKNSVVTKSVVTKSGDFLLQKAYF